MARKRLLLRAAQCKDLRGRSAPEHCLLRRQKVTRARQPRVPALALGNAFGETAVRRVVDVEPRHLVKSHHRRLGRLRERYCQLPVKRRIACVIRHAASLDDAHVDTCRYVAAPLQRVYRWVSAKEIMQLKLQADLVILSACETGLGRIGTGEGMIGLTWAFMNAGAAATVVSQWEVRDDSTADLMIAFHRNLKSTKLLQTKAEALRQAALAVMKNEKYRHPFYWASFVMVGNGN